MRTFLVWSVVFLSGFVVAAIVLPMGGENVEAALLEPAEPTPAAIAQQPTPSPEPIASSPSQINEPVRRNHDGYYAVAVDTLSKVKNRLRDPNSATFRNLVVVHVVDGSNTPESSAVCGEMNSQNGFGAYTGFVPFIAADTFMMTAEHPNFGTLFATNCTAAQSVTALTY